MRVRPPQPASLDGNSAEATQGSPAEAAVAKDVPRIPLLVLVFIAGMVSLGIEMCGPRLMAPYFGTSLFIWANQIGFTLIYLSLGYFIGGRVADRYPQASVLCGITAIAAIATGIIPFVSRPVLDWSVGGLDNANASVFLSSMIAVILLFSVPTILLGMVSPFAVRLTMVRVGEAGRSAGTLYALSTAGSILGAFLPVLVLTPWLGVRMTFYVACVTLLVASLWGLLPRTRRLAGVIGILLLIPTLLQGPLKSVPGMVFEQESLYNYIQVVRERDGTYDLILNEGAHAVHSKYHPDHVLLGPNWYADYLLAAPYFNQGFAPEQMQRLAIIGLAGGTIARQYTAVYGPILIDGVEIDPAIIAVGQRYFGMTEPNLRMWASDGRAFLRATRETYDVIAVDAFQQPYMPFQFTTKEFFEEVRGHLSPIGVVTITTGHTCRDYRLVQAFVNTLSRVFPSVYAIDIPNSLNTEIIATMQPTRIETLQENLYAVQPNTLMGQVAVQVLPLVRAVYPEPGGIVFSDDRAPVEQYTDQLILSYIRCL